MGEYREYLFNIIMDIDLDNVTPKKSDAEFKGLWTALMVSSEELGKYALSTDSSKTCKNG